MSISAARLMVSTGNPEKAAPYFTVNVAAGLPLGGVSPYLTEDERVQIVEAMIAAGSALVPERFGYVGKVLTDTTETHEDIRPEPIVG
ncbi:hypothetical protein [Streptomyces sp. NPDC056796]|uniref:hypothetical protein n=1 Tax=Streptomyces sp. NPDC056796 TaxID=3345947 RepID=UPI0036C3891B